jgi:uncharacterized protein
MNRLRSFFWREDEEYTRLGLATCAHNGWQTAFFIAMHIIPGFGAYLGMYVFREDLIAITGLSSKYVVALTLLTMAFGWHIGGVFAWLRWIDKLSLHDSLSYLGLNRWDWKGMLVIVPLACLFYSLVSLPYDAFITPTLRNAINAIPAFHIYDWHIQKTGYFNFPLLLIILSFVGAHLGEEIYFRGFLLQKISHVRFNWMINAVLFMCYHVWQAPVNWARIPIALLSPVALLVMLRKSLWVSVLFHVFVNFLLFSVMVAIGTPLGIGVE